MDEHGQPVPPPRLFSREMSDADHVFLDRLCRYIHVGNFGRVKDHLNAFYRDLGCLIAIDDFGAGHSNFERIWALSPHLVKLDRSVVRCYLLRPDGVQIGSTVASTPSVFEEDARFDPLKDAKSADWFRRHYLRRAIVHADQLQVTRPYLSITGSHMCVTLSMMFSTDWGRMVLCCDIDKDAA